MDHHTLLVGHRTKHTRRDDNVAHLDGLQEEMKETKLKETR